MAYNYYTAMADDIRTYIDENIDLDTYRDDDGDIDRRSLEEDLNEGLWASDDVTGNIYGYTDNNTASEYVADNLDILHDAVFEFGEDAARVGEWFMDGNYIAMDVTIRCYLLSSVLSDVLDEIIADDEDEREAAAE